MNRCPTILGKEDAMIYPQDDAEPDISLTVEEKWFLLRLARRTLQDFLTQCADAGVDAAELTPGLLLQASCFVTLREGERLRGCIGNIYAREPLYRAVMESSIGAATRDYRFPPVSAGELPRLTIHISILTPFRPLQHESLDALLDQLVPGRHGVLMRNGWQSALYLPQVWERFEDTENLKEEFLASLSLKAGDETGTLWMRPGTTFEVFEAISFGEDDLDL
jgi:AmmeMemoRadiSam system protein A